MRSFALILGTVVVFVAGGLTGRWYESHRPLPPPPGGFMGEVGGHRYGQGWAPPHFSRADFNAELERLAPEFENFRRHMDGIDEVFERNLDAILTPAQRTLNADRLKRRAQNRAAGNSRPRDEQLAHLAHYSDVALFRIVTLQLGYDSLNHDLKFDRSQKDKVFEILRARREQFLSYIDQNPPPSLHMLSLAPFAQRLAPSAPPPPPPGSH